MLQHEALPASLLQTPLPPASLPSLFEEESPPASDGCRVTPGLGTTASLNALLGPKGPRPCATRCPPRSKKLDTGRRAAPWHGAPTEAQGVEGRLAAEGLLLSSLDGKTLGEQRCLHL